MGFTPLPLPSPHKPQPAPHEGGQGGEGDGRQARHGGRAGHGGQATGGGGGGGLEQISYDPLTAVNHLQLGMGAAGEAAARARARREADDWAEGAGSGAGAKGPNMVSYGLRTGLNILTEGAASTFTAIMAVGAGAAKKTTHRNTQHPRTATCNAVAATWGLNLTCYLGKFSLQVGRPGSGVGVAAGPQDRETEGGAEGQTRHGGSGAGGQGRQACYRLVTSWEV